MPSVKERLSNIEDRLDKGSYQLDPDFFSGFKTAVKNNQVSLSLEYLLEFLTDLKVEVAILQEAQSAKPEPAPAPTPEAVEPTKALAPKARSKPATKPAPKAEEPKDG